MNIIHYNIQPNYVLTSHALQLAVQRDNATIVPADFGSFRATYK